MRRTCRKIGWFSQSLAPTRHDSLGQILQYSALLRSNTAWKLASPSTILEVLTTMSNNDVTIAEFPPAASESLDAVLSTLGPKEAASLVSAMQRLGIEISRDFAETAEEVLFVDDPRGFLRAAEANDVTTVWHALGSHVNSDDRARAQRSVERQLGDLRLRGTLQVIELVTHDVATFSMENRSTALKQLLSHLQRIRRENITVLPKMKRQRLHHTLLWLIADVCKSSKFSETQCGELFAIAVQLLSKLVLSCDMETCIRTTNALLNSSVAAFPVVLQHSIRSRVVELERLRQSGKLEEDDASLVALQPDHNVTALSHFLGDEFLRVAFTTRAASNVGDLSKDVLVEFCERLLLEEVRTALGTNTMLDDFITAFSAKIYVEADDNSVVFTCDELCTMLRALAAFHDSGFVVQSVVVDLLKAKFFRQYKRMTVDEEKANSLCTLFSVARNEWWSEKDTQRLQRIHRDSMNTQAGALVATLLRTHGGGGGGGDADGEVSSEADSKGHDLHHHGSLPTWL